MGKILRLLLVVYFLILLSGCKTKEDDSIELYSDSATMANLISTDSDTMLPDFNLELKIGQAISNDSAMYSFNANLDKVFYVGGYGDVDYVINELEWYKFSKADKIEKNINGKKIVSIFKVVEGIIVKDLLNDIEINEMALYYFEFNGYLDQEGVLALEEIPIYEDFVFWGSILERLISFKEICNSSYIPIVCNNLTNDLHEIYEIVVDNNISYFKHRIGCNENSTGRYVDYKTTEYGIYYESLTNILIEPENNYFFDKMNNQIYFGLFEIEAFINAVKEYKESE